MTEYEGAGGTGDVPGEPSPPPASPPPASLASSSTSSPSAPQPAFRFDAYGVAHDADEPAQDLEPDEPASPYSSAYSYGAYGRAADPYVDDVPYDAPVDPYAYPDSEPGPEPVEAPAPMAAAWAPERFEPVAEPTAYAEPVAPVAEPTPPEPVAYAEPVPDQPPYAEPEPEPEPVEPMPEPLPAARVEPPRAAPQPPSTQPPPTQPPPERTEPSWPEQRAPYVPRTPWAPEPQRVPIGTGAGYGEQPYVHAFVQSADTPAGAVALPEPVGWRQPTPRTAPRPRPREAEPVVVPRQPYRRHSRAAERVAASDAQERTWALVSHIGGLLTGFVVPLLAFLACRNRSQFLRQHTTEALNFQLMLALVYISGAALTVMFFGVFVLAAAWVFAVTFGTLGALAANDGDRFRYPVNLRVIA